jgi:hypothetical protein
LCDSAKHDALRLRKPPWVALRIRVIAAAFNDLAV